MLKNKAQIARQSIKTTLELPGPLSGPWTPAESEFGFANGGSGKQIDKQCWCNGFKNMSLSHIKNIWGYRYTLSMVNMSILHNHRCTYLPYSIKYLPIWVIKCELLRNKKKEKNIMNYVFPLVMSSRGHKLTIKYVHVAYVNVHSINVQLHVVQKYICFTFKL